MQTEKKSIITEISVNQMKIFESGFMLEDNPAVLCYEDRASKAATVKETSSKFHRNSQRH
jgi:hypothetical protein